MQRKCFCLWFHSFELMVHRQTNPTIAKKLKIKKAFWPFPLFFGGKSILCVLSFDRRHPPFFPPQLRRGATGTDQTIQRPWEEETQKMPLKTVGFSFPRARPHVSATKNLHRRRRGTYLISRKTREKREMEIQDLKQVFLFRSFHASFLSDRGCQT